LAAAGEKMFSFTLLLMPLLSDGCGNLNGVLADGVLYNAEKLVLICVVDNTHGANAVGFVADF